MVSHDTSCAWTKWRKTTVVVPPGSQILVDAYENYLVTLS